VLGCRAVPSSRFMPLLRPLDDRSCCQRLARGERARARRARTRIRRQLPAPPARLVRARGAAVKRRREPSRAILGHRALLLATVLLAQWARADASTLARVGPLNIDVAAFERRAELLAPFQWQQLGTSWQERRRGFLESVLIREALLDVRALADPRANQSARDNALSQALTSDLAASVAAAGVLDSEVAAYYSSHARQYQSPRSLLLWRILVRGEQEARSLLATSATPDAAAWSQLAREHSIDTATSMRAGSLGYVAADGQTHMPQVRVSPQLFKAAEQVSDGQIVPAPVAEGQAFAIVWRRASRPASSQSLAEVTPSIRAALVSAKLSAELLALTDQLRNTQLSAYSPERLEGFSPKLVEPTSQRAPELPPMPSLSIRPLPEATEQGLR
jgi:peptidyl-prolyl cis-trans isomerase C